MNSDKITLSICIPTFNRARYLNVLLNDISKNFEEFNFIDEDTIISYQEFGNIFEALSGSINYRDSFRKRLGWYYQQILKLSFIINFVDICV